MASRFYAVNSPSLENMDPQQVTAAAATNAAAHVELRVDTGALQVEGSNPAGNYDVKHIVEALYAIIAYLIAQGSVQSSQGGPEPWLGG